MIATSNRANNFLKQPRQVIAVLRVLVLVGLTMLGLSTPPRQPFLFWFLTIVYGLTNFGYLWARSRELALRRVRWVMFVFDVITVSAAVILRGEQVQSFVMAYFALVLMAAIADGLGRAPMNAALIGLLHVVLTRWGSSPQEVFSFTTLSTLAFFFIIAVFMGHIADEARGEASACKRMASEKQQVQRVLDTTSTELEVNQRDLRVARESLRANDRLATLGMLSAGIAHEIKTPLAAISAGLQEVPDLLEAIRRTEPGSPEGNAAIEEMRSIVSDGEEGCAHLQKIVGDLTSLVRTGSVEAESVDPAEVVDRVARLLRPRVSHGAALVTEVTATFRVHADRGRLLQVLLNLGANGLDSLPEGSGTLTLRCFDQGSDCVSFEVEDTGSGIPESVKARMFEPFFTTKGSARGTGLGLHIVSEIVKAHDGHIDCETTVGMGTRFRVDLPAAVQEPLIRSNHEHNPGSDPDRRRRGGHSQGALAHVAAGAV